MKILKLKFKNINSLAGENEIDFTNPIFTNDGLFAITGKTGAGKSSILDAISIAFFGKTPRVNITGNENDVMTRGEKDCFSEIEFEVAGKKWKSSWKQELNRNGNLKPVNRTIADFDNRIVADKVNICDSKIIEILGLTFDQFTKVIMLAQGSFAAFLQADNNDKGKLLEQITGTEIYAQISKNVFERNKSEKDKLDKLTIELDSIRLLSEIEIISLSDEILLIEQNKKQLDEELLKLEAAKKWLSFIDNLQNQIIEAKQKLPELEEKKETATKIFEKSEIDLKASKDNLEKQEPIFRQVRVIDTKISEKEKIIKPIINAISQIEKSKTDLTVLIENLNSDLGKSQKSLIDKQNWAKENKKYELLVSEYSAIEKESQLIVSFTKEIEAIELELNALKKETESKETKVKKTSEEFAKKEQNLSEKKKELISLKTHLTNLLLGKELSQIQSDKESLSNFSNQIKLLIEIEIAISKNHKEIKSYEEKILQFENTEKSLRNSIDEEKKSQIILENQINLLEENITLSRTIQSLNQHRQNLKDGVECPLCGSLNHPFALGNVPQIGDKEKELKSKKNQFKEISNSIKESEKELAKLIADRENSHINKLKEQENLSNSLIKQGEILNEMMLEESIFSIPNCESGIEKLYEIDKQNHKQLNQIISLIEEATKSEILIKNYQNNEIPRLQEEIQIAEILKYDVINELKLIVQQFQSKNDLYNNKKAKQKIEYTDFKDKLNNFGVENIQDLKKCLDSWNINTKQIEEIKNQILLIEGKIALNNKEFDNLAKTLSEKNLEKQETENDLQKLLEERNEIFANKSVDIEESNLKIIIEKHETAKIIAEKEKNYSSTEIEKFNAIVSEKEKELLKNNEQNITIKSKNEIQEEILNKKLEAEDFIKKIGANNQTLKINAENLAKSGSKIQEKEIQKSICSKWGILNELIGSSDGKKYRNFAQALTFEHLIGLSNKQLQRMSERYILKITNDISNPFELSVIDKYQNSEERTAKNLSGGEKFIVSLSLALGLANMASKNMRIDTMFIDEGFGTLDSDYLDVALNSLSNLQSEGKIIGVISHLTELKERIATHIEVVPGGNGHSKIQIKA